jgi:hypothetical protein
MLTKVMLSYIKHLQCGEERAQLAKYATMVGLNGGNYALLAIKWDDKVILTASRFVLGWLLG